MKPHLLSVIVFCLLCCSCTTTPVSTNVAKSIPSDRVYNSYIKYSNPVENGAKVIIVRDSGILGSAGSAALFANGEIVARVKTGEVITLHLKSGDNILGVGPGTKLKWEKDNVELIEQTLNAEAGKTYFYRITIDSYKGLVLQRTSQVN